MNAWIIVFWAMLIASALPAIYALHRLALWLEERGWLFYEKQPTKSPVGCFVALQQVLEPTVQHVLLIKDEKRHQAEEETPGQGNLRRDFAPASTSP